MRFQKIALCAKSLGSHGHGWHKLAVAACASISAAGTLHAMRAVHDDAVGQRLHYRNIAEVNNKIVVAILCNNMPSIECYWDICGEYVQGTKFEIYVPANLLSDYKRHEDLEKISDHIHSIGGEYTSMGTYYDGTIGYSYEENFNESNSTNSVANRYECRACRNTGDCPLCEGKRQTYTKRVYNYNLGCYDLDYEICRHCHGDGKCPACKGDGWLDEGIDY